MPGWARLVLLLLLAHCSARIWASPRETAYLCPSARVPPPLLSVGLSQETIVSPRLPWVLQTRQGRGQAGKDHPRPHHGPPTWVAVLLWGWPHLDPLHAVLGRLGRHTLDLRLEPLPAEGHSHVSTLLDLGSGQHTPAQVVGQTCVGVNMCSPVCSPASEVGAKHGPWGRGQEGWHLSRKNLESDTREIVALSLVSYKGSVSSHRKG